MINIADSSSDNMRHISNIFSPKQLICPDDVQELIDFRITGDSRYDSMARLQYEGVAALYNILCRNKFAYLADEVGMGKTYQALGLASIIWNLKKDAKILFISPRQALQEKWRQEYRRFFANNYRRGIGGDDRVSSILLNMPVHEAVLYNRLSEWAVSLSHPRRVATFLRHTSFTRPVFVSGLTDSEVSDYWRDTRKKLAGWGLHGTSKHIVRVSAEDASRKFNLEFAKALNQMLSDIGKGEPVYDLVVVDEAQCLRNPYNQTNNNFFEILRGHAKKWLFMSATPVHSGPNDLANLLNRYPEVGEVITNDDLQDIKSLQQKLKTFMVRRQRKYVVDLAGRQVSKTEYRFHDDKTWAAKADDTLSVLTMGLVQKGLVKILEGRNNRYRIGMLDSFESLQSSIRNSSIVNKAAEEGNGDGASENTTSSDYYNDGTDRKVESKAVDTDFIDSISTDFEANFGFPVSHPKLDRVVDEIAPIAFSNGDKFLVFSRRISTVDELRDRLDLSFHQDASKRISRCWERNLDWSGKSYLGLSPGDLSDEDGEDPEHADLVQGDRPFRAAMAKGGWLYNYRRTFRASGRNALFFEENWLERLCRAGGKQPSQVAELIPEELWAESLRFASRGRAVHRVEQLRYLAIQGIQRFPNIFGLTREQAIPWVEALIQIYPSAAQQRDSSGVKPTKNLYIFSDKTFWSYWDEVFFDCPELELPGGEAFPTPDNLYRRQIIKSLIGQSFRLTDVLLDLFFAEITSDTPDIVGKRFFNWLSGPDLSSVRIRKMCSQWIQHLDLILQTCFEEGDRPHCELAQIGFFRELNNLMPVVGITGGSGGNPVAIRQFRMPTYPNVIVCTDTLKEGVDLHTFCDKVVHYGIAWTSGDLEQRIGRVDRFFSQIERRLRDAEGDESTKLLILYPHVANSLEQDQVERVIERQRVAEAILDTTIIGGLAESRELSTDPVPNTLLNGNIKNSIEPFANIMFPSTGCNIVYLQADEAQEHKRHYTNWMMNLADDIKVNGFDFVGDYMSRECRLITPLNTSHFVSWGYDADLSRYMLTISPAPWKEEDQFSSGYRLLTREGKLSKESFVRIAVPRIEEQEGCSISDNISKWFNGLVPVPESSAHKIRSTWNRAFSKLPVKKAAHWDSGHKCTITIFIGSRSHQVRVYSYQGLTRIVARIAKLADLPESERWDGMPTFESVTRWTLMQNSDLSSGFLQIHPRDGLCYAVRIAHGNWEPKELSNLVRTVAQRADIYEATLMGHDII